MIKNCSKYSEYFYQNGNLCHLFSKNQICWFKAIFSEYFTKKIDTIIHYLVYGVVKFHWGERIHGLERGFYSILAWFFALRWNFTIPYE